MKLNKALNAINHIEHDLDISLLYIRKLVRYIYNIIIFAPDILNFHGWDYCFTMYILRRCLIEQYKELRDDGLLAENDQNNVLKSLKTTIEHINRHYDINDVASKQAEKRSGFKFDDDIHITKFLEKDDTKFKDYCRISNHIEEDSWHKIWNSIDKHMRKWWD